MPSLSKDLKLVHPSTWDKRRLHHLLVQMRGKRIAVVGDVGVDRYTYGMVERISPEAPVPIVRVEREKLKLGLAANVADNIVVLGGVPLLMGTAGKDRSGDDLKNLLQTLGVSVKSIVQDKSRRTVLKERVVSEHQQLLRVDYESDSPVSVKTHQKILGHLRQMIRKVDGIIIQDYAKGLIQPYLLKNLFDLARKNKKMVLVDPHYSTPLKNYRGATVLNPNKKEAEILTGIQIQDESSLVRVASEIFKQTSAKYVVITLGKDGMAVFSIRKKTACRIPTYAREVYDVSGAGDTVISVLGLAISSGASIDEAAVLGNLAAGVEVGKRGTATVSVEEIVSAMGAMAPI